MSRFLLQLHPQTSHVYILSSERMGKDLFFFNLSRQISVTPVAPDPPLATYPKEFSKLSKSFSFFLTFMVRFFKSVGPLTFFISSPMAKAFDSDFPYRHVRRRDFRLLTAQSVGNWEEEAEGRPRKMLSLWALGSCAGKNGLTGGFVTLDVFQH